MNAGLLKMLSFWPKRQAVGQEEATQHFEAECLQGETSCNGESLSCARESSEHLVLVMGPELGELHPSCCQDRCLPGSPQHPPPTPLSHEVELGPGGCVSSPPGESEEVPLEPWPCLAWQCLGP